jgi:hypothetical protein
MPYNNGMPIIQSAPWRGNEGIRIFNVMKKRGVSKIDSWSCEKN